MQLLIWDAEIIRKLYVVWLDSESFLLTTDTKLKGQFLQFLKMCNRFIYDDV